jgi:signal transduction histidine kinase
MSGLFHQIGLFLQQSPGNVFFHLVILFSIFATFQVIWINQRNSRFLHIKRLRTGLVVLLIGQGLILVASMITQLTGISPQTLVPTLDRAVIMISLIWIIWLWIAPKPSRFIDRAIVGLSFFFLILWIISLIVWFPQSENNEFNTTGMALGWDILLCILSLFGAYTIIRKRPFIWSFGFVICILIFIGGVLQILLGNSQGNLAGILRLSFLVSFPLLPFLAMRLFSPPVAEQTGEQARMYRERRRYSADPRTLQTWLHTAQQLPEGTLPPLIAKAIGQTMLSDICYLILAPRQQDDLIFLCGYDLIREVELPGFSKPQTFLPVLSSAVQRAKPYIYNVDTNPIPELDNLADAVDLRDAANTMYVPLANSEITWGGILLLSPFAERIWTQEDQKYLQGLTEFVLQTLLSLQRHAEGSPDTSPEIMDLQKKQTELDELQGEFRELLLAYNELQLLQDSNLQTGSDIQNIDTGEITEEISIPTIPVMTPSAEGVPDHFDNGTAELIRQTDDEVSQELQLTLEELSNLQGQLTEARTKIVKLEKQAAQQPAAQSTCPEFFITSAQEIRRPLSSLIGYIDILESETAGEFNEIQRSFLERIKIATEKLHTQLENLIQQSTQNSPELENSPSHIELMPVIDLVISDNASDFLEKDITFRMDVSNDFPSLMINREALIKVLSQLLQNAIIVTPAGNSIFLKAYRTRQDDHEFIVIQITDSGVGLSDEEISLIQSQINIDNTAEMAGLGILVKDMLTVKNLVNKLDGRLWIESQVKEGTSINVILPITPEETQAMDGYDELKE